jgi:hypothetical protein
MELAPAELLGLPAAGAPAVPDEESLLLEQPKAPLSAAAMQSGAFRTTNELNRECFDID